MFRLLTFALAALLAGCGPPKVTLNVLSFSDHMDPNVVRDFEREQDCRVVFDFFAGSSSIEAKLAAGGMAVYDVVLVGTDGVESCKGLGLLSRLRHENIPNLKNIAPEFTNLEYDPRHDYSVPYHWGVIGLYIRKAKNLPVDETWGLIFDPAKQSGPFLLLDELRTCLGAALRYKGYSVNTLEPQELAAVRDLLIEAKRRSQGFHTSTTNMRNQVLSRTATVVMSWNDNVSANLKQDSETYFFVPREGSSMALDSFIIPAKAPHRDLAEKFLNYLLDAKVAAQNAIHVSMATPNSAAKELLSAEIRNNPAIYPPVDVMRRLEPLRPLGDKTKLYDEIWTQIKSR